MTTLKPYPAYKDSGVSWLGNIPQYWNVVPLKRVTIGSISGVTPPSEERRYYDGGSVAWYGPSSLGSELQLREPVRFLNESAFAEGRARRIVGPSLLVTIIGAPGKSALLEIGEGSTNQQITAFPVDADVLHPRFLAFQFRLAQEWIAANSSTSTISIVDLSLVKSTTVALPPLDEQRAIANFLDGMDARITRFIAARRKMIALLEEKKQAVINQAVTRGLDPNVPMKDSGVDWLGEIPAHWEKGTLRQLCDIAGGMTPTKSRPDYWQGIVPWVSPKDMKRFRIGDAIDHISESAVDNTGLTMLPVGSVLLVVRGMILARKVPIAITARQITINQDMKALLPNARVQPEYLAWVLTSGQDALFPLIDEAGHGTRRLPTPSLLGMIIPAPPIEEQLEIIDHIDRETSRIDTLISRHRREIELMQEYRTRLISDVVTGKLDVRGVELRVVEDVVGEVIEAAVEEEQTDLEPVMSGEDD